ncbi:hypothetical protein [Francisella sp. 19X1-34]|uniref:hypothetical protein n=1 Tax=Francisella sp. 19X1-34 TaxID=3087177 RepID=UPI002E350EEA|nr:hypothetical protein [Francisella sp. 19X1-34]MED7789589.1 hypothetical protein [Francisella sp. 19X1-34]
MNLGTESKIYPTKNQYDFFDDLVFQKTGDQNLKIRLISENKFSEVSKARQELYANREKYFLKTLFENNRMLDSIDRRSFIFAAFYNNQIIGLHRHTPAPFEVYKYIEKNRLDSFLGSKNKDSFIEMSRLVIDRKSPIKYLQYHLTCIGTEIIRINTNFKNFITFVKPRLMKYAFPDLGGDDFLNFRIPERKNNEYVLIKGNIKERNSIYFKDNFIDE